MANLLQPPGMGNELSSMRAWANACDLDGRPRGRQTAEVIALLAASMLLLVLGLALFIGSRWQAVTSLERALSGSRAQSLLASVSLTAAAIGVLLLIVFVALALITAPTVAA